MHEIITLQLGQRANYLATHFWNTQESYFTYDGTKSPIDHDVHFRPGVGADGTETFTPRTVIYDLKGGFGTLRKLNALYELEEDRSATTGVWNGSAPVIRPQAPIEPSAYQVALEIGSTLPEIKKEDVRYWSDFNRCYFHPKSVVQLNEYELNSALMPFENWETGEELFNSLDKEHDLLDRDLRPFAEEADQMQGIQIMASMDDAWGGFAAKYLDRLRDEYGKTTVYVWGLEDSLKSTPRVKQFLRLSNTARSICEVSSQASVYIPMSLPSNLPSYVNLDPASPWHVAGLFSTALECMTIPSRLCVRDGKRESLNELANAINVNGNQNIAKLQMSISYAASEANSKSVTSSEKKDNRMHGHEERERTGDDETEPLDMSFFPSHSLGPAVRGPRSSKKPHIFGEVSASRGRDYEEDMVDELYDGQERARRRAAGLSIVHKTTTPLPYTLLSSFPHIYNLSTESLAEEQRAEQKLAVRTNLSTDTGISTRIRSLRTLVGRGRVEGMEREQLGNSLGEIAEAYVEGWESGSDSDDD